MYSFYLKNKATHFDIVAIRAVFAVNATAAFVQLPQYGILAIIAGCVMMTISIFLNTIKKKLQISSTAILIFGIVLLCIISQSIYFLLILLLYWLLQYFLNKQTKIDILPSGLLFTKPLSKQNILWQNIEHIVLKDGLLTIDYIDNVYFQSEVSSIGNTINEAAFNQFCIKQLHTLS